jgi:hypothetical protein
MLETSYEVANYQSQRQKNKGNIIIGKVKVQPFATNPTIPTIPTKYVTVLNSDPREKKGFSQQSPRFKSDYV